MNIVDVRGLNCPEPLIEVKKIIDKKIMKIKVLCDSGTSCENITRLAENNGYKVTQNKAETGIELILAK